MVGPTNRRLKYRRELSGLYLPSYDILCDSLPEQWQPYSGNRSFFEQGELYLKGRKVKGPGVTEALPLGRTVTDAKPGESPHNYGCATDWTLWDGPTPIWLPHGDAQWVPYFNACKKANLALGAEFFRRDNFHNELKLTLSWRVVKSVYDDHEMSGAMRFIERNLV